MAENSVNKIEWNLISKCDAPKWLDEVIIENEKVRQCYKTVRDVLVLTNSRIILSDKQGVIGKKNELYSIPYRSINAWSSENKGVLDISSELTLITRVGNFKFSIAAKCDIRELDRILAAGILSV